MDCRLKWLKYYLELKEKRKLDEKLLIYSGYVQGEKEKGKDKYMISIPQIQSLVKKTCSMMGDKFASDDAVQLVVATGIVESRYEYIKQMGNGPARSFWQVEAATCVDNLAHYLKHRPKLMQKCARASLVDLKHWQSFQEEEWAEILEKNIAAGIVHCRLKYWRVPKKMPNTIEGQAAYWKKYYNTEGGAGNPEHFIDACRKYLT